MSVDVRLEWINHLSVYRAEFAAVSLMSLLSFCVCVDMSCPSKQSLTELYFVCYSTCVSVLCIHTSSGCIVSVLVTCSCLVLAAASQEMMLYEQWRRQRSKGARSF